MLHSHLLSCFAAFLFVIGAGYVFMTKSAKKIDERIIHQPPEDFISTDCTEVLPPEEMDKRTKRMWKNIDEYRKAKLN